MKKYLLLLLSLTCINAFAQQPALDPEKQKRIQEFLAKEIPKMPDPIARMEEERRERMEREKAVAAYKKNMESEEVQRKIAQLKMFENMQRHYNGLDEAAKTAYRADIFKHGFKFFDDMKKKEADNPSVLIPSGDLSKFVLTYADKDEKDLSQFQIERLTEKFSRMVCETPHLLIILGVDIPIEGVFNWNGKDVGKVNLTKKDCKYIDFNIK